MNIWYKNYLSKEDLKVIASKIGEAEKTTSGEIRVVVRHRRHLGEAKMSPHEIAHKEFFKLGMEKTKHRTGILIMVLFSKRQFHIAADEGIHAKVPDGTWDNIAQLMTAHFKKGNYRDGICEAVQEVGKVLSIHFPREAGDVNELPNDVIED
ncbi:MAG: TPM domain-containing protein [Bacteroidota bacterium]